MEKKFNNTLRTMGTIRNLLPRHILVVLKNWKHQTLEIIMSWGFKWLSYSIKHLCTKEGCFFVLYVTLRSPKHLATLGVVVKPSMSKGGSSWFHIVSKYSREVMNYWTNFSLKNYQKINEWVKEHIQNHRLFTDSSWHPPVLWIFFWKPRTEITFPWKFSGKLKLEVFLSF